MKRFWFILAIACLLVLAKPVWHVFEPKQLAIYSVNPSSAAPGAWVMIKGEHFSPKSKIFFDEIPAAEVRYYDSQTLFVRVPNLTRSASLDNVAARK